MSDADDPRLADPMLHDALLRARHGGAHGTAGGSNGSAEGGPTGAEDAGLGGVPPSDPELDAVEDAVDAEAGRAGRLDADGG
jgi:hypothetical protein